MEQTPGAKMMYLIRRKPATSREELVAHWFANHMPAVILYYHHHGDSVRWRETIEADGMETWIDPGRMLILSAQTEMVGIR